MCRQIRRRWMRRHRSDLSSRLLRTLIGKVRHSKGDTMFKRFTSYLVVALVSAALTTVVQPLQFLPTQAQSGCRAFPETGKSVCGLFLQYWQLHGGLAQQGYPLTNEFTEVSDLNGQPYTVQYFERAVF